jgi:hypothetical protein
MWVGLVVVTVSLAAAAPAKADTTLFKAQFVCNDRGAVYPLANARVELWQRGWDALPKWLTDSLLFVSHLDAEGRVAVTVRGDEDDFYFRIVLADNAGVRAEDWWAPWAWFADTPTNQNDVPVQDYGTQGLGNGTIPPECSAFEGARRAYHGYEAEIGARPPYDLKVNLNSPSAGVPYSPYVRMQWPPRYPTGDAAGGFEKSAHEFAHTLRHALDGDLAHFFFDVGRFNYLQQHKPCNRTNEGFAFNEGWAEYWARSYGPAPNCPGKASDDYAVEGNVAAALDRLDRTCRGIGRPQMVEVLRNNRGRIHSFEEFRAALPCQSIVAEPPGDIATLRDRRVSLRTRLGFGKVQLSALTRRSKSLGRQLRDALRATERPNPCRPKPCVEALIREIRPALLAAELQQTRVLRSTLAFEASKRGLKKLGEPARRRFQQGLVKRQRSLARALEAIGARAVRDALAAARPYLGNGGKPVRAIGKRLRAALRGFRAGRLPTGFGLTTPAGTPLRRAEGLPLTTSTGFDDVDAGTTLTDQYASRGVRFGHATDFGQPSPGPFDCGAPAVQTHGYAVSSPNVALLPDCNGLVVDHYSGTFGQLSSPALAVGARVRVLTTCDGPCFFTLRLVGYDAAGMPVANASIDVGPESWDDLSAALPAGAAASIRSFAIFRDVSWAGSLVIDDLNFQTPG